MTADALKELTIALDAKVRSAFKAIDRSKCQIALVVDNDSKLVATVPYGVVRSNDGLMTRIEEKPTERYFVNGCVYILSPEALDRLTSDEPLDMPDLLTCITGAGGKVGAYPLRDYWRDIGRIDDLEAARSEFDSVFRG